MEYDEYLKKMQNIQINILEYIEKEPNSESDFPNLMKFLEDQKIREGPHILKEFLRLISNISNNHHRTAFFFDKIDNILLSFKTEIMKDLYNYEIYTVFRKNYRIMFFLLKEEILKPDISIFSNLTNKYYGQVYYPNYFLPEFKLHFQERNKMNQYIFKAESHHPPTRENNSQNFENKRKIGQNDSNVCRYVRKDNVEEFDSYTKSHNLSIAMQTHSSIFETNSFLINRNPTLIEYAAFMGSINIFNYLIKNGIELTPPLWLYAIHSQDLEFIRILENNKIQPEDELYNDCLLESIKCHHFEITDYILNSILKNHQPDKNFVFSQSFRYSNYHYFPNEMKLDFNLFFDLCKYDYYTIVEMFLKENINFNQTKILIIYFLK